MSDDNRSAMPKARPPAPRPGMRIAIVTVALVAAVAISLAFAPVRSFAGNLLSIFRVQKIATVSITADDIQKIGDSLSKGDAHISLDELGDVYVDGKVGFGSVQPTLTTLAAAQAAVDFPIKVPTGVEGTQSVLLQPGTTVKFKLHIDKVNELLRYYGATKLFSSSLDGKEFAIKMPPTVYLTYGKDKLAFTSDNVNMEAEGDATPTIGPDPSTQDVFIVQTRGPELVVPNGVNPLEIRDVIVNLPFLPQSLRSQLAGVSDWQSTLLIPNLAGSTREISVAGNPGVVIKEPVDPDMPADEAKQMAESAGSAAAAVMWHQDGVLRAVGSTNESKSLSVAESMAR